MTEPPECCIISFHCRYFQATGEDRATGHKAKSPLTHQTKGAMTVWVATETAHGILPGPGIRVFRHKPQETLESRVALTLQGPMELEPSQSLAHPSLHSKRGSHSANQGPLRLKLRTLEGNSSWPLLSPIQFNLITGL